EDEEDLPGLAAIPPAPAAQSDGVTALRTFKPHVYAQRRALVLRAEEAAILQLGDDQIDKVAEPARQVGGMDEETVDAVAAEPRLHVVGDVDRRADQRPLPARAGETLINLPDRQLLLLGPADDVARRALARQRPVAFVDLGKRAVEVIF